MDNPASPRTLANPLYYLDNFQQVLDWVGGRYADLLDGEEQDFIRQFGLLPPASRALLVRLVMRRGPLFKGAKLHYPEIGTIADAAAPLVGAGMLDDRPLISLDELFGLLTKAELQSVFGDLLRPARKPEQLDALRSAFDTPRAFQAWHGATPCDTVYRLQVGSLCERLRLIYFGNLHQDWSAFVLAELGIHRYETVELSQGTRGFALRADVDHYLALQRLRERLDDGDAVPAILADLPAARLDNPWLAGRRTRLLFHIGQRLEKEGAAADALTVYATCEQTTPHAPARLRRVRLLERLGEQRQALDLAQGALGDIDDDGLHQQLARTMPRLRRKLGISTSQAIRTAAPARIDLMLPAAELPIELQVASHFASADAPVYYVENTLFNALFGLLCWDAIFAALPGAFFHPYQIGPADLYAADFVSRRRGLFDACLNRLDIGEWQDTIKQKFNAKHGILSPFVAWEILTPELLDLALDCIPPDHLRACFTRMLRDVSGNCAGFPDLIQFWPREQRYRMIEVKGPGDKLQDNQIRFLDHCAAHGMPAVVCFVTRAS